MIQKKKGENSTPQYSCVRKISIQTSCDLNEYPIKKRRNVQHSSCASLEKCDSFFLLHHIRCLPKPWFLQSQMKEKLN